LQQKIGDGPGMSAMLKGAIADRSGVKSQYDDDLVKISALLLVGFGPLSLVDII
jgi:hypothetical protein